MNSCFPFVTILTPVYNGEKYLAECIESVLAQIYRNWEYIIINNCSTDRTLAIAENYARKEPRIQVLTNEHFVGVIENHNIAFRLVSKNSKYCKVVSADDGIYPNCILRLIEVAEANPSVGIVGSYQLRGKDVKWQGLPHDVQRISGREACRFSLLNVLEIFGGPTSQLYLADLVREHKPFFPHSLPYSDTSACYKYLQFCDFGFVHEILSFERIHDYQESAKGRIRVIGDLASLEHLLDYGPIYLSKKEFEIRKNELLRGYYRWLGGCVLKMREKDFWIYQISRIRERGYPISWKKVIEATISEIIDEIKNPRVAFHKILAILEQKYRELIKRNSRGSK